MIYDIAITPHQLRQQMIQEHGKADEKEIREHAVRRVQWKRKQMNISRGDEFDVFTNDPNCKSCGKGNI